MTRYSPVTSNVIEMLQSIVGPEYVSTRTDILLTYSSSASMAQDSHLPEVVVRPGSVQEISQILMLASKHRIPVTPRSGGSSLQGEVLPRKGGIVVELMRLNEIILYEDLRTVTVGAGVTFGQLDRFLQKHGLWLPVSPESALVCTVAGNVAVNGAGPGSSAFGCIGEMVIGLEVVLPDGRIIRTGSEANPYAPGPFLRYAFGPDLTGLFIGSLGAFGIITKVSLKTFKRMTHFYYNTYGFDTPEQAERFLFEVKQNEINAVFASIYEGPVLELFMEMLGDEYGIPSYEWPPRTVSMTIGRSRKDQLESDVKLTEQLCLDLGGFVIGIEELPKHEWDGRLWTFARACYAHGWHWRTLYHHPALTHSHKSVDTIKDVMDKYGFLGHTAGFLTGHISFNAYPHLYFDPADKDEEEKIRRAHDELARRVFRNGAVPFKLAPYWGWCLDGEGVDDYFQFLKLVKQVFDPNNIMNPEVLGGI